MCGVKTNVRYKTGFMVEPGEERINWEKKKSVGMVRGGRRPN